MNLRAFPRTLCGLDLGVPELGRGFHEVPDSEVDEDPGFKAEATRTHCDGRACDCMCECTESETMVQWWQEHLKGHKGLSNELIPYAAAPH